MRWFAALTVLVALAVTPVLSLVCDTWCLNARHASGPAVSEAHPHHVSHVGHDGRATVRADVGTVSASPSGPVNCAAHLEPAVPVAPRQSPGACAAMGATSTSPVIRAIRIALPSPADPRPPLAPLRPTVSLRI